MTYYLIIKFLDREEQIPLVTKDLDPLTLLDLYCHVDLTQYETKNLLGLCTFHLMENNYVVREIKYDILYTLRQS